ncbi:hypothetical protein F5B17DRAFT_381583, partial [Nemania serpens]
MHIGLLLTCWRIFCLSDAKLWYMVNGKWRMANADYHGTVLEARCGSTRIWQAARNNWLEMRRFNQVDCSIGWPSLSKKILADATCRSAEALMPHGAPPHAYSCRECRYAFGTYLPWLLGTNCLPFRPLEDGQFPHVVNEVHERA